jgi:hypothetical protein
MFFWRTLTLLLALRLLVPPGICLCHLFESMLFHSAEAEEEETPGQEDEHAPGCPTSSTADGYATGNTVTVPGSCLCLWTAALPSPPLLNAVPGSVGLLPFPPTAKTPVYLMVRALLI